MPRRARLHVPGGFYHVTLRGNHRQAIFHRASDYALIESFVDEALARHQARLHAYCWMTNHVHLLLQVGEAPLGRVMQRIASRYARAIQARVPTTGHLFERRYHALLVDADAYLRQLVRYIHANPLRAGMVKQPHRYPWSSHRAYLGLVDVPTWLHTDVTLAMFGPTRARAIVAYRRYTDDTPDGGDPAASPFDAAEGNILGDEPFRLTVAGAPCRPRSGLTLEQLIVRVCAGERVDPGDLAAPGRGRRLAEIRAQIAKRALEEGIASLSEVARRFNRDESTLRKTVERRRSPPE